jgi:hypothetical protein
MELKPQDVLVLLKQVANPATIWTYATLAESLHLSASQAHRSVQRCLAAGLAVSKGRGEWQAVRSTLLEFAVHGVRYAFPATQGSVRRGIPTSFGTPPLSADINSAAGDAPIWPHPSGTVRGPSLSPLCKTAPDAALADPALHEMLALLDALRAGRSRERALAKKYLAERMEATHAG